MKILGVTFTTNVYDIWNFNSIDVLNKVKSILTNWSKKKTHSFWARYYNKVIGFIKICITVSVITKSPS